MSLSLHHAQAQDLYEEKRSHESLAEKRRKTRVKQELECVAAAIMVKVAGDTSTATEKSLSAWYIASTWDLKLHPKCVRDC